MRIVDFLTQVVEIDPQPAHTFFGFRFAGFEEGLRRNLRGGYSSR